MLLLKKKKYAAVTLEKDRDGNMIQKTELKGNLRLKHNLNNISKISKTCSLRSIERISVDFCFSSVLFYTSYVLCWWNLKERVGPKSIFNIIIQTVPLLKIFDPR